MGTKVSLQGSITLEGPIDKVIEQLQGLSSLGGYVNATITAERLTTAAKEGVAPDHKAVQEKQKQMVDEVRVHMMETEVQNVGNGLGNLATSQALQLINRFGSYRRYRAS